MRTPYSNSPARLARRIGVPIMIWACLTVTCEAQSIWELTPYRIQTWVVTEPHPLIPRNAVQALSASLQRSAQSVLGAVWDLDIGKVPDRDRAQLLTRQQPTAEDLLSDDAPLTSFDKLFVFLVAVEGNGYTISVCELDIRTQVWSPWQVRSTEQWSQVADDAFALMCDVFVPLAQIRRIDEDQVTALLKAGALQRPESSARRWKNPTEIQPGDVLRPIVRRSDRNGKVRPGGAKPIPWTLLIVEGQDGGELQCKTFSGYRQPFTTRRSSRVEQLALLVRPQLESTTLMLHNRRDENEPLAGYDVFTRRPGDETSEFVGRTNWQGRLEVMPDPENPIRILFVKSGNQLLGKLPIVPGSEPLISAALRNDDRRLEAEGFLLGIQESLVDLVARREVLTNRIRARIESGKLDEAEQLLDQLRGLDTQEDFARRVQQRKQSLTAVDAQVQQRIDKLFADTRTLLGRFLDPNRARELQTELEAARRKQG